MLHRLAGGDDRRIEHVLVGNLAGHILGLIDDAVDRRAVHRVGFLAKHLEYLLEALDMALGLPEVGLEAALQ